MFYVVLIILAVLALIGGIYYLIYAKRLRYGNLTLVSGGVKTGKTELCVALAIKEYRKQLRKWKRERFRCARLQLPEPEKPLLYSNMPIGMAGMSYAPLTMDLITGKSRFRYGSVVYFNEISFIAGSKDIRDEDLNDILLKFFKLCAHETKGGYFFIDTQSPQDMHYTLKRSLSTYYHIYRRLTLPFISLLWIRENMLVDGDNTVAVDTQIDSQDKVSEGGRRQYPYILSNKWWKYYDRYAYSVLTDDLPVSEDECVIESQKVNGLLRLRNYLKGERKK